MMRHVLDRAFSEHDAHEILIDPLETNTDAIGFYKHLGFTQVGPRRFGTDDCLVLQMQRPDGPQ
jgi:aminoglycoside 6'-N-acetyltransferase